LQATKTDNTKINCKTTGGIPRQILPFAEVKTNAVVPEHGAQVTLDYRS